jgi:hypothetical protein
MWPSLQGAVFYFDGFFSNNMKDKNLRELSQPQERFAPKLRGIKKRFFFGGLRFSLGRLPFFFEVVFHFFEVVFNFYFC